MRIFINPAGNSELSALRVISPQSQFLIGSGITVGLLGLFLFWQSPLVFAIVLGAIASIYVVRSPAAAIFVFILSNIALEFRPKYMIHPGAPGLETLLVGILMAGVLGYWVLRLRVFEHQPLSVSRGQLFIVLFALWSVFVTCLMAHGPHSSFPNALREMIDFVPLLILPILYLRFVEYDSALERSIQITIFAGAFVLIVWNIIQMKNHVAEAVYLYQIGRGNTDETLAMFMAILSISGMMAFKQFWMSILCICLLMLAIVGITISSARTLYIVAMLSAVLTIALGARMEIRRGIGKVFIVGLIGIAIGIILYFSFPLFRILTQSYFFRLVSSQHLETDLSLRSRYSEWHYLWLAILRSPILGYGFGSQFRFYDILLKVDHYSNFSHSSYLYLIFKTGFFGALLFFAAYVSFLLKGLRLLRSKALDRFPRIIVRACVAYLVGILFYCLTAPELNSKTDLIWIGLMWGYFLSLDRHTATKVGQSANLIENSSSGV